MNRPANMEGKVKLWGVWLDADVAGRNAGRVSRSDGEERELTDSEKADIFFGDAIQQFNKGQYAPAAALLGRAVELTEGGAKSRKGGEYLLWKAQALFAQGEATRDAELRREGTQLLRDLKTHSDGSVGRVSQEILYIFEAPKLELEKESFVEIPDLSKLEAKTQKSGRQAEYAKIEPGLEKYSVEWLQLEQTRFKKPAPVDPAPPLIAAAFGLVSLALFLGH